MNRIHILWIPDPFARFSHGFGQRAECESHRHYGTYIQGRAEDFGQVHTSAHGEECCDQDYHGEGEEFEFHFEIKFEKFWEKSLKNEKNQNLLNMGHLI